MPILAIQSGSPAVVIPDLGLVFAGGAGGAAGIVVEVPKIVFIQAEWSSSERTSLRAGRAQVPRWLAPVWNGTGIADRLEL